MTTATTMYATGYDPDTLQPVFVARTPEEKQAQRQYFFWYKEEETTFMPHPNKPNSPSAVKSKKHKKN